MLKSIVFLYISIFFIKKLSTGEVSAYNHASIYQFSSTFFQFFPLFSNFSTQSHPNFYLHSTILHSQIFLKFSKNNTQFFYHPIIFIFSFFNCIFSFFHKNQRQIFSITFFHFSITITASFFNQSINQSIQSINHSLSFHSFNQSINRFHLLPNQSIIQRLHPYHIPPIPITI